MKATILMQKTVCAGCGGESDVIMDGFIPVGEHGKAREYFRFRLGDDRSSMVHCEGKPMEFVGEPYEKETEYE